MNAYITSIFYDSIMCFIGGSGGKRLDFGSYPVTPYRKTILLSQRVKKTNDKHNKQQATAALKYTLHALCDRGRT